MGCPSLTEVRAYLDGDEGALLDAYAESTGLDGWQHALDAVQRLGWPAAYTEDGNAAPMPPDAGAILDRSKRTGCLLQIRSPVGLRINCSFDDPDEIEFDFDPREFTDQRHVDDMCGFISVIGRTLAAAVNVGTESAGSPRPDALLTYEPAENRVVVRDWRRNRGEPLVLRPSCKGTIAAVAMGLLFAFFVLVLASAGDVGPAVVVGLFAIVGIGAGITGLRSGAACLRLDDQGFEVRSPLKSWKVGWSEIERLERAELPAGRRGTTPVVEVVFRDGFERQHVAQTRLAKLLLPDEHYVFPAYGSLDVERLQALLDDWRAYFAG